ncbi:UDP-N-acetylmuramate dehydrogenase [Deinobacterium chartae]|uniref:UDP-N-acetylenolpyruvoylglucosamine reductase n=1 Tax=Deinobacterium chartae TaxID=521158 RepID=A0A841HWV8_9DEIO|nr:UDP-N-acetylmuramate dehydrogenase [Deinobacterium chartae]
MTAVAPVRRIPMSRLTTLGVGGEAEVWSVGTLEELREATAQPYRVLGGGSNLVVADAGLGERVIKLVGGYAEADLERDPQLSDEHVYVTGWIGAGKALPALVRTLQKRGLSGLEGLVGIPAAVGGAVWMNAGTRFGEMFDALHSLEVYYRGEVRVYAPDAFPHRYRSSGLPQGAVVTRVRLRLTPSTPEEVEARMQGADLARKGQPKARTAGCAFKNPPGESAGRLIDRAGLKGTRVGNAMISHEHGNFVINLGGATAEDVITLLRTVQEKLGLPLEWEYELWE